MLTIKELINLLEDYPPNTKVIIYNHELKENNNISYIKYHNDNKENSENHIVLHSDCCKYKF